MLKSQTSYLLHLPTTPMIYFWGKKTNFMWKINDDDRLQGREKVWKSRGAGSKIVYLIPLSKSTTLLVNKVQRNKTKQYNT